MGHEPDIASAVDAVPAKRKRVVKSKPTRTGCQTCRNRRVKCDEARPVCNKCISSGRSCGGYFGVPISREASSRPLLPASSRSPSTASEESLLVTSKTLSLRPRSPQLSSRTPSPTTPLTILQFAINSNEQGAFDFFQIRMAGPLDLMSPAKGWVQQALQLSVASQAVFHGIAALSNANLAMASVDHVTFSALTHPERYTEALSQYNKAIFALSNLIRDVLNGQAPLQPVLLTCLLLMCFEVHAERNSMAIRHHQLGRKIAVKYLSDKKNESFGPSKAPDSVRELANAFEKLRFGSALMEHDQLPDMSTSYTATGPTAIAQTPRNDVLVDAWSRLDDILDSSSQVLRQLYTTAERHVTSLYGDSIDHVTRYCLATCASKAIELPTNGPILTEVRRLLAAHDAWNLAFSAHFRHPETARAFALLQVREFASSFALATCRDTRETAIDRFENDFVRILDLAEQYLRPWTAARRPVRPRSVFGNGQDDEFCMDDGILSALSLIVIKCRTSTTRRRAREMLVNANRREGLGSSTITAQIAGDIARLEEERVKDLDPNLGEHLLSYQVPETARFADIARAAGGDLQRPACRLACARYLHESDGSIEVVEYWSRGPCFPYSRCAGLCRTGFHFEKSKPEVQYRLFARGQDLEAHALSAFHETRG